MWASVLVEALAIVGPVEISGRLGFSATRLPLQPFPLSEDVRLQSSAPIRPPAADPATAGASLRSVHMAPRQALRLVQIAILVVLVVGRRAVSADRPLLAYAKCKERPGSLQSSTRRFRRYPQCRGRAHHTYMAISYLRATVDDTRAFVSSDNVRTPNKKQLSDHARLLGELLNSQLHPYTFSPCSGSLYKRLVRYVSYIDLQFLDKEAQHGGVCPEEFEHFVKVGRRLLWEGSVLSMKFYSAQDKVLEVKLTKDEDPGKLWKCIPDTSSDLTTVVLSGAYKWQDFFIPLDISLQRGKNESRRDEYVAKFARNLDKGDFAKAVQRARAFLKEDRHTQKALSDLWNDTGGKARFLFSQFALLKDLQDMGHLDETEVEEYCHDVLGMRTFYTVEAERKGNFVSKWRDSANQVMQDAGRDALKEHQDILESLYRVSLSTYLEDDFDI